MVSYTGNNFFPLLKQLRYKDFVATFGCLLMLAGGISLISLVELLLTLVRCLKPCDNQNNKLEEICKHSRFQVDSSQFYHMTRDVADFLKMTSIHGVHYLTRSSEKKVLWSLFIVTAASLGVHFVYDSIKNQLKDPVFLEISDQIWNARDVIIALWPFSAYLSTISFQVPFPSVTFCPDFDRALLDRPIDCLLKDKCDGLNHSDVLSQIQSLKAGSWACQRFMDLKMLENDFPLELLLTDYRNKTLIDHLQKFLDPAWSEQNSFCMEGRDDLQLQESLAWIGGLCFTLNFPTEDFYEKT